MATSARWVSPSAIRHEAGHAVMYWHTRHPFRYVTIRPRKTKYIGYVYPYNLGRERRLMSEQDCINFLMRRAAGPIAENYFNTHAPYLDHHLMLMLSQPPTGGSDHDLPFFIDVATKMDEEFRKGVLSGQKGPRTWIGIWDQAQRIIEELWPAVEAVAVSLDKDRTLTGSKVFAIAAAAMGT